MSWAPGAVVGWLILIVFGGGLLAGSVWAITMGAWFVGVPGLVLFVPVAWIMLSELKTYWEVVVLLATLVVAVVAGVGIGVFADNALARTRKRRAEVAA